MSILSGLPVEYYLKAISLIKNYVGEVGLEEHEAFAVLLEDLTTRESLVALISILCSITAVSLEGLGDLFEGLTGDRVIDDAEAIEVAHEYLDTMIAVVLSDAVHEEA